MNLRKDRRSGQQKRPKANRRLETSHQHLSSVQGEMLVTCLKTAICFGALLLSGTPVFPQIHGLLAATPPEPLKVREVPVLDELRFTGLRRIAPAAVAAQLTSREVAPFDAAN